MRRLLVVALLLLGQSAARAGDDLAVFPADQRTALRSMLRIHLLAQAKEQFDARRAAVAKLQTAADVQARQKALRGRFVEALGGWPARTPLRARVVGKLAGKGYTVEKVVYESRPGHHVTASFYLPDGKGPFPGVLMPIGHSSTGKAADYVQRGCILLASNGIAALAYDPIGQGERRQLLDEGKPAVAGSTTEHTLVGVGALLVGWNTASYRIWDGVRSLDYLAGRPEIDPRRLGCTGCSGGGTLTSYLMALDDRIVAAAPSCYITSLERLFATIGPQDAEQNITGQVALGLEHADYLTLRAPRATLVLAATRDFFDIQGTWASFREAKRLYGLLGQPERVDIVESNTGHGYPKAHREAMLRWMRRWLAGKDDSPGEGDFPIRKEQELRCTRTGQVLEDLKGVSAFGLTAQRARELAGERKRRQAALGREGLRKAVAERLGLGRGAYGAARRRLVGSVKRDGYRIDRVVFEVEPGIQVPALEFRPAKAVPGPWIVYVHGEGKAADAAPGGAIERLARAGRRVLAVDLRGLGETAPAEAAKRPGYFGVDFRETYLALHLDRPLLGQRVVDLLRVVAAQVRDEKVEAVGIGKGGLVVLHAAALDDRIARVRLERSLTSWTSVAETPLARDQLSSVVPGALAVYDLPELGACLAPRPVEIVAPVDPTGKVVSREVAEKVYAPVKEAYERSKAGEKLVVKAGEEARK